MTSTYTVPGLGSETANKVAERLQQRLVALIDLSLTLKHVHWNVVGPSFIGVHEMLDDHVEGVRIMVDDLGERIATLGRSPKGTPGFVAEHRSWEDYGLDRAPVRDHLRQLDRVYDGIVSDHRKACGELEELDLVTQDMLLDQTKRLEWYQWLLRAHLEDGSTRA